METDSVTSQLQPLASCTAPGCYMDMDYARRDPYKSRNWIKLQSTNLHDREWKRRWRTKSATTRIMHEKTTTDNGRCEMVLHCLCILYEPWGRWTERSRALHRVLLTCILSDVCPCRYLLFNLSFCKQKEFTVEECV